MKYTLKNILIAMMLVLLASCWAEEQEQKDHLSIWENGIDMKVWSDSFTIWEDGISINSGWESINIGEKWISINADGESLNIGEKGISINSSVTAVESSVVITEEKWFWATIMSWFSSDEKIEVTPDIEIDFASDFETQEVEVLSCSDNYTQLLEKHGKSFANCSFKKPDVSSCSIDGVEAPKVNIAVVFDSSWSMWAQLGGETMMDIAKDQLQEYIRDLDDEVNVSFTLYGHKWAGTNAGKAESCAGVENIYNFSKNNKNFLLNQISGLTPNGWTPIAASLEAAKKQIQEFAGENDKNIILLVSDGIETCGGNPIATALKISKTTKNTYIDVIWFNVSGDTQRQLSEIANKWEGTYYDVKSRIDFENTFQKTSNVLDALSCGASKSAIELSYGVQAINTYFQCMYELKEEEVFMMVDADDSCKDYFEDELDTRRDLYEFKFEEILEQGEEILDNFAEFMEEVEDNIR